MPIQTIFQSSMQSDRVQPSQGGILRLGSDWTSGLVLAFRPGAYGLVPVTSQVFAYGPNARYKMTPSTVAQVIGSPYGVAMDGAASLAIYTSGGQPGSELVFNSNPYTFLFLIGLTPSSNIILGDTIGDTNGYIVLQAAPTTFSCQFQITGTAGYTPTGGANKQSIWHAIGYDTGTNIYLDGSRVASAAASPSLSGISNVSLDYWNDGAGGTANGASQIAFFAVYNRLLTPQEHAYWALNPFCMYWPETSRRLFVGGVGSFGGTAVLGTIPMTLALNPPDNSVTQPLGTIPMTLSLQPPIAAAAALLGTISMTLTLGPARGIATIIKSGGRTHATSAPQTSVTPPPVTGSAAAPQTSVTTEPPQSETSTGPETRVGG